jgi:TetR/AcrR family transcriptional repressor of mexCD-oprJ operon
MEVIDMSIDTHEDDLLKKLTSAVVANPRGTTQALAQAAGISRATFNRFCGSRENLMNMISERAELSLKNITDIAKGCISDYAATLSDLINAHFVCREYLVFSCSTQNSLDNPYWNDYLNALDEFFLAGQKARIFRFDLSHKMLSEFFVSAICGMIDAEYRGRVATSGLCDSVYSFFLNGATVY